MDIGLFIKAAILGIVEGATEFIPVSSTGHLIIVQSWLDFTGKKEFSFSIFIQLGAILAVMWLYRKKLFDIAFHFRTDAKARQLIINLTLGTIPAVIIGTPTAGWIEAHFFKPFPISLALVLGGIAILIIERYNKTPKVNSMDDLPGKTAFLIGIIQVLAILFPGVSRSGATIMGGLILGLSRTAAIEFSFFLAIPAIFGASILKLSSSIDLIEWGDIPIFSTGFIVSCISALLVIKGFLSFISRKSFIVFAWYRIIFGVLFILIMLTR